MAIVKDTVLYIGEDIYGKLPEEEQETFGTTARYKPDAIGEQLQIASEADKEWKDPFGPFEDLEDYEDFWGDDFSQTGGFVYEKVWNDKTPKDEKRFEDLSKKVVDEGYGNQLRIKYVDLSAPVTGVPYEE